MRILHVIVSPGHAGGAENAALALSRALRVRGLDVTVARMSTRAGTETIDGVPVKNFLVRDVPLLPKPYANVFSRSAIATEIVRGRYDLVHVHNTHPALALWDVAKRCMAEGIPYVVTTHGLVETLNSRQIFRTNALLGAVISWTVERPLKQVLIRAAGVAALSMSEVPLLTAIGVLQSKIHPIYNGANERFLHGVYSRKDVRTTFHIAPQQPIILFVGNVKKNKGIDVLLRAVPTLDRSVVVVVGETTQPKYAETLQHLVHDLNIGDRVVFTGHVNDDVLYSLYTESRVFVLPTLGDTFPLVVLDAMSAKKPVVASAVGGIPEQLGTDAGYAVPAGDVRALAEKVNLLLRDSGLARRMGEAGFRRVKERFTWARVAERVEALYNTLL